VEGEVVPKPLTILALVRASGISRTTLLYYESAGLLRPARRSAAGYRLYGPNDLDRVRRIRQLRSAGLTLEDIKRLLDEPATGAAGVLSRRLEAISGEIEALRDHQLAILRLLASFSPQDERKEMMTKEKWVEMMRKTGFSDEDMHRWHRVFETSDPEEHELFLRYLQIPEQEIRQIREWSRK
jgi:DNA-binding transcriptional MerR regulator